jgi:poly(3-hydroxybutyrate) depolymerase
MAYQLACHASDVVAGVVVIAASEDERRSDCGATNPVSVFHIHGLFDRAVNFSGGTLGVIPEVYAPYPSAHDTVSRWVVRNACVESGFISGDPQAGEAGAWTECAFGTRVQYRWLPTGHRVEPTPALMTEIVEFIDLVHRSAAMVH